jgi:hypothetical protein
LEERKRRPDKSGEHRAQYKCRQPVQKHIDPIERAAASSSRSAIIPSPIF